MPSRALASREPDDDERGAAHPRKQHAVKDRDDDADDRPAAPTMKSTKPRAAAPVALPVERSGDDDMRCWGGKRTFAYCHLPAEEALARAPRMSLILAVFLMGSAASLPPDDDDRPVPKIRTGHVARARARHDDDDDDKPKAKSAPAAAKHDHQQGSKQSSVSEPPKPAGKPEADGGHDDDHPGPMQPVVSEPLEPPVLRPKAGGNHDDDDEVSAQPATAIIVTARKLDAARTQINAGLGASVYSLTNEAIENRPGGETGSVADILSQAPGVTRSGSTLNVRGSPTKQVRINDVIVPEAVSDPADLISSRLAQTTRLITGTLPAQFGFAPAGVISITTKNGLYQHGGELELFGGTGGMLEPAFEWAGSAAQTSLFASGELEHDQSIVADVSGNRIHARRTGIDGLGFADHVIDDENRVSLLFGGSHEHQRFGQTSVGRGSQTDDTGYSVATYQHSNSGLTVQASVFAGGATDATIFAASTRERRSSWGTQIDTTDAIGGGHVLRFGVLSTRSLSSELEADGDRSRSGRTSVAVYAQDEWKLAQSLTFNPGVRLEWLHGIASPVHVEPRASLVWQQEDGFSAHVGYARYTSAPALGDANSGRLADERDDYLDAGFQRKWGALTLGVDSYLRSATDYVTELVSPGSALSTAFAFKHARFKGVEMSATYARQRITVWTNLAVSRATARTILGGQSIFPGASLAAASTTYLPLVGDRPLTASGGFTERLGKFSVGGDVLASSGSVGTTELTSPNESRSPGYVVLGLAAVYHTKVAGRAGDLRLDLTNLTNADYLTSDASSLEGGWTQHGRRRAITVGLEQSL